MTYAISHCFMLRSTAVRIFVAASLAAIAAAGQAQTSWPKKPVRVIVPYAAGGTTDFAARKLAQNLSDQMGQMFYVENKGGASGTIGTREVARSAPDGYTLLANDTTYAMLPSLFARLPWDHQTGLVPVTTLIQTPVVLVVPATSGFKSAKELIDFARANPGKLNFGSGGQGSSTHLSGELFKDEARIDITHVPYKGAGQAMQDLMAGQIDILITAVPTALGQIKGNRLRALAVTGEKRVSALGAVPTFKEAGMPNYNVVNWFGLAAPKGTPNEVILKLHAGVKKALLDPAMLTSLEQQGAEPGGMEPKAFADFVRNETRTWTAVAKRANVRSE
jgi:tripartite-type tricarboxylate transporter receptor subunit TctC